MAAVDVGQTDSDVVYRENALAVHRYEPEERRHETPILIVYALVNRPYILDLQPDRSVIRRLLGAGFRVYLVDWGEPSRLDATLDLTDYVTRYLDNCVDAVRSDAETPDLHLLGYCMGATMASMYAARNPGAVRTLTCMAMPFAFDGTGGILERWARTVDPALLVETYGNVPAPLLAVEFAMLNPVEHLVTKYVRLYENLDDAAFVETFARMERWIWDGVDVPGAAFREFIDEIYRENQLLEGAFELDGEPVPFGTIDVPVLQIVGADDDIVPPASSAPFGDVIASEDIRVVDCPVGHVGLSVSSHAHDELWPTVGDWLAARSRSVGATTAGPESTDEAVEAVRDVARQATDRAAASAVEAIARRGEARLDGGDALVVQPIGEFAADVEAVEGIGATYGDRLRAAGIETVADLRAADTTAIAEIAGVSNDRASTWHDHLP